MKIRILIGRAGNGFAQNIGDIVEVGQAEYDRLIANGTGEPVAPVAPPPAPVVETAMVEPAAPRKRKGKAK